MPRIAYVNGSYIAHNDATVPIEDRGLQFADSVYEVIGLVNGKLIDERGHIDRLCRSLSELDIALPMHRRALSLVIRETVRRNRIANAMVYIQVTRGTAPRDFRVPDDILANIVMTVRPLSFDIAARKQAMKKIITLPDMRWQRRDIKTTGLLAQVMAKQAALAAGADDAWMVDVKKHVTEGSSSNAWIVTAGGVLMTRSAAGNTILKGVTRTALLALCKREKIKFSERAFTVAEAKRAKEAFMSSATALIMPVSHIDGKKIGTGKIGRVTERVFDLYMDYALGNHKQEKWTA